MIRSSESVQDVNDLQAWGVTWMNKREVAYSIDRLRRGMPPANQP